LDGALLKLHPGIGTDRVDDGVGEEPTVVVHANVLYELVAEPVGRLSVGGVMNRGDERVLKARVTRDRLGEARGRRRLVEDETAGGSRRLASQGELRGAHAHLPQLAQVHIPSVSPW
jgi:hypothetical protein